MDYSFIHGANFVYVSMTLSKKSMEKKVISGISTGKTGYLYMDKDSFYLEIYLIPPGSRSKGILVLFVFFWSAGLFPFAFGISWQLYSLPVEIWLLGIVFAVVAYTMVDRIREVPEPILEWKSPLFRLDEGNRHLMSLGVLIMDGNAGDITLINALKSSDSIVAGSMKRINRFNDSTFYLDYRFFTPVAIFSDKTVQSLLPWRIRSENYENIEQPLNFRWVAGRVDKYDVLTREIREWFNIDEKWHYFFPGAFIATSWKHTAFHTLPV